MKSKKVISVLAVAICLTAAFWVIAQDQSLYGVKPTAVAVVDIFAVLEGLDERVQVEADLQSTQERLKQEGEAKQKEIDQLQQDLNILAADSEARVAKQKQFDQKNIEARAWLVYEQQQLVRKNIEEYDRLYRQIVSAVERTAKANGYDVVLQKEQIIDLRKVDDPQKITPIINMRKVIWAAAELDLTDQVITLLNSEAKKK